MRSMYRLAAASRPGPPGRLEPPGGRELKSIGGTAIVWKQIFVTVDELEKSFRKKDWRIQIMKQGAESLFISHDTAPDLGYPNYVRLDRAFRVSQPEMCTRSE